MNINQEHYFVLNDGRKIKSLEELTVILKNIKKDLFEYHVNDQKNDFANWIRYVFKTPKLAELISDYKYGERAKIITAIKKYLKEIKILVINAGSSSLKYQLFEMTTKNVLIKGLVDAIGLERCNVKIKLNSTTIEKNIFAKNHEEAIKLAIDSIYENNIIGDISEIKAIGHRVVHGGELYTKPTIIDSKVIEKLSELSSLAPLHNPPNIACIIACQKIMNCPQVAIFDTAFHSTIPKEKYLYGLPYEYYEKYKIRKYGFHGTSHKYISKLINEYYRIQKKKKINLIVCHLGNGSSITAVKNGKSINTTMGFTPTDGVIMGTRSGSIDPGVILHLEKILNINFDEVSKILNKKSGLLGISSHSDMRDLRKNQKDKKCKLAMDMFADRITHFIGAYIAELNSINAIAFTAGIGENAFYIRKKVLDNFKFLGLRLDDKKNQKNDFIITRKDSKIDVFVLPTNEELEIAEETKRLLNI